MPDLRCDAPPLFVDWRGCGKPSDWECRLGDRRFSLHKVVVGWGSRGSGFFRAAFNDEYRASGTDLTELLPQRCHEHMETVLDFMYGKAVVFSDANALMLYKIADVLQIESLSEALLPLLEQVSPDSSVFGVALDLQLPSAVVERIVQATPLSSLFGSLPDALGASAGPDLRLALAACSRRAQSMEFAVSYLHSLLAPGALVRHDAGAGDVLLGFALQEAQVVRLGMPLDRPCRVRVECASGTGATVGVTRATAACAAAPADGGFAREKLGWGLSLASGKLFSQGFATLPYTPPFDVSGKTVRMELDADARELKFFCEEDSSDLGTIMADFEGVQFTVGAGDRPGNRFALLGGPVRR